MTFFCLSNTWMVTTTEWRILWALMILHHILAPQPKLRSRYCRCMCCYGSCPCGLQKWEPTQKSTVVHLPAAALHIARKQNQIFQRGFYRLYFCAVKDKCGETTCIFYDGYTWRTRETDAELSLLLLWGVSLWASSHFLMQSGTRAHKKRIILLVYNPVRPALTCVCVCVCSYISSFSFSSIWLFLKGVCLLSYQPWNVATWTPVNADFAESGFDSVILWWCRWITTLCRGGSHTTPPCFYLTHTEHPYLTL